MKFLACSRCFSSVDEATASRQAEVLNPLVITKRPVPKLLHENHSLKTSFAPKSRFPGVLRVLSAPWRRRKKLRPKVRLETRHKTKKRDLVKERGLKYDEKKSKRTNEFSRNYQVKKRRFDQSDEDNLRNYHARRHEELEREYNEHLEALKFLIDPPDCFKNPEMRQNFENKLNTLDFRRMNTVAISSDFNSNGGRKFDYYSPKEDVYSQKGKFSVNLDEFVQEHLKIEQTMINLLNREPILKKDKGYSRDGSPASRKTVRFKVDGEESKDDRMVEKIFEKKKLVEEKIDKENTNAEREKILELGLDLDLIKDESFMQNFNVLLELTKVTHPDYSLQTVMQREFENSGEFKAEIPDVKETDGIFISFLIVI